MPIVRYRSDSASPRRSRRLIAFLALSLLIHGALLYVAVRHQPDPPPARTTPSAPMAVRLLPPAPPAAPPVAQAPPVPKAQPKPPAPRPRPPVVARREPTPHKEAPPQPPERQVAPPEMDMMAMIESKRARRDAAEAEAAAINAEAARQSRGMTPNEIAMANINRDLQRRVGQRDAIGGLFRIVSKGPRMATYQFRGWMPDSSTRWQQTIEVDAGPNGDVEIAIVRSMIALIRKHHDGDFNWESHRLGRVVQLSARPQDTAQLETFLMKEFFGG